MIYVIRLLGSRKFSDGRRGDTIFPATDLFNAFTVAAEYHRYYGFPVAVQLAPNNDLYSHE